MNSKSSMGIVTGAVAGMMLGAAIGMAAGKMMKPKSPIKKKVTGALETVSDMLNGISGMIG